MKKFVAMILVLALLVVFNGSVLQVKANPTVWNVPMQFPTITAALQSGLVAPGDTIHVWQGAYIENPVVGIPNIKIIGQSTALVTIQAAGPGPCFSIIAPGITIMELSIVCPVMVGGTFGIYIFPSFGQCKIWNNVILNFDYGIYIDNSPSNEIIGNEISNCMATQAPPPFCSTAIYINGPGATNNIIRGNELGSIAPNWYGVGTNGASGNTIIFNNFWIIINFPQAFVVPGDINTWDNPARQKGNWWSGALPPYVIDPLNIDNFCHPAPFNWALYPWDVNRDCTCSMTDIATIAKAFGAQWSSERWHPKADLNGDGNVDMQDIGRAARNFGWSYP
ncbi:MAG: right-handed parallel beta-helix repeat-containing protein [Candidatus Bathyarchaeia archaeon]